MLGRLTDDERLVEQGEHGKNGDTEDQSDHYEQRHKVDSGLNWVMNVSFRWRPDTTPSVGE
jgi:hypothetical protein